MKSLLTKKWFWVIVILFVLVFVLGVYWIHYLKVAHSTFENYYEFRGCTELLEKTDSYGICKLSNGEQIRLVKYDNRWFLDGDLPLGATSDLGTATSTDSYIWQTFSDKATGVIFLFPQSLNTKYISLIDWPPKVTILNETSLCSKVYCSEIKSEGAAGSTYSRYFYTFVHNNKTVILNFTLRFVQCANYDNSQKSECEKEWQVFNPDNFVSHIVETLTLSASSIMNVRYFGNEATGDLNDDGLADVAYLITEDGGGSGTFYYVVVALKTAIGYETTNSVLLGDRIAPQSTYIPINSQELQINYAERKPGEPMVATPSVGVTLLLKVTPAGVLEGLMK